MVRTAHPWLAAARRVARSRDLVGEMLVRVFAERSVREPLLVAQLHPAEVEHGVLHRDLDSLPAAGVGALIERRQDPGDQVDAGPRVADLCTGRGGRPVFETGGGHRAAHRLRDDFVGLEVEVLAGAESLDRRIDQARVDLTQRLPGEPEPIDDARTEILDEDVDAGHQIGEDLLPLVALHVEGDAAFVAVEHREIQAVGTWDVAKLTAGDVSAVRGLQLDDVRAEPGEQLRGRGARLDMCHVEHANAVQGLTHDGLGRVGFHDRSDLNHDSTPFARWRYVLRRDGFGGVCRRG